MTTTSDHRTPIQIVNVIDVEATCWAPDETPGTSEIIEIGVTVVDTAARAIVSTESILLAILGEVPAARA